MASPWEWWLSVPELAGGGSRATGTPQATEQRHPSATQFHGTTTSVPPQHHYPNVPVVSHAQCDTATVQYTTATTATSAPRHCYFQHAGASWQTPILGSPPRPVAWERPCGRAVATLPRLSPTAGRKTTNKDLIDTPAGPQTHLRPGTNRRRRGTARHSPKRETRRAWPDAAALPPPNHLAHCRLALRTCLRPCAIAVRPVFLRI